MPDRYVEVGTPPGLVGVRDTKRGAASAVLAFNRAEWGDHRAARAAGSGRYHCA
ncbi:MAG: DUF397 domain-containing protein [Pseudonocardia sp.]|nr:DUF397 domain-containing protein [Pseudonocardia sp.]